MKSKLSYLAQIFKKTHQVKVKTDLPKLQGYKKTFRSRDEYDAQKLKDLDKTLSLNTFSYPVKENEAHYSLKYIKRFLTKSKSKELYLEKMVAVVKQLVTDPGQILTDLRNLKKRTKDLKETLKPQIDKVFSIEENTESYSYLTILSDENEKLIAFLDREMDYFHYELEQKIVKLQRIFGELRENLKSLNDENLSVTDNLIYSMGEDDLFVLKSTEYWNAESMLNWKSREFKVLLDWNQIANYFFSFKDDFSYMICRKLKIKPVNNETVRGITMSSSEKYIALELLIDDRRVTIIKDVFRNKYANFYFKGEFMLFDFFEEDEKTFLIFCLKEESEVRMLEIITGDFFELAKIGGLITSVTKYLRSNHDNLLVNQIEFKQTNVILTMKPNSEISLLKFGKKHVLGISDSLDREFHFFYIFQKKLIQIPVK